MRVFLLRPPVVVALGLLVAFPAGTPALAAQQGRVDHGAHGTADTAGGGPSWRMPPMETSMPMLPSLRRLEPKVIPFLPLEDVDPATLPEARPPRSLHLADGDTLVLRATPVRRELRGRTFALWGYNGQIPGPLIEVSQGSEIVVRFVNEIEMPGTVHWHGVRVENRFDGVPGVTQEPVAPGEDFLYRVRFPDDGIYWYHPHLREDIQQDLGLYGNILVRSPDGDPPPVNVEETLVLDDLLVDARGIFPYGRDGATHTLMGRFGNLLLVNGDPDWRARYPAGSVVRFRFTNVSNTRTFNLDFGGAPMKLVGADIGRFEREQWVEHVVLAPAQRYVVDVRFPEPGAYALRNRIQAVDHYRGEFYPRTDTLGRLEVTAGPASPDHAGAFRTLHVAPEVRAELERYRRHFRREPDHRIELTMRGGELPLVLRRMMEVDTLYFPSVEWNDAMPMMNYASSVKDLEWVLRDPDTGRENMGIGWNFRVGDVVKVRIHNPEEALHPMQHPIHLHGQRFLVLAHDGVPTENLAWKDTVLVPSGSTVDILVEMSNPGAWMVHCHIAEHLEAGMHSVFEVRPVEPPQREGGRG